METEEEWMGKIKRGLAYETGGEEGGKTMIGRKINLKIQN